MHDICLIIYVMMMNTLILNGVAIDHEQQEILFYEWCSLYDDLKHIKQRKVA
jgi:hypothetical protein